MATLIAVLINEALTIWLQRRRSERHYTRGDHQHRLCGWLHERDGNYAAFDDAGRHLGDFATLREALRVIPRTNFQQKETTCD